jgi:pre-mRNA-splicing factor ATP-dependent RNA helicase DHX38/PRP16
VTSATLEHSRFADFFGNVPIFRIPGRTFDIIVNYSKNLFEDYVLAAIKKCITIHKNMPEGDILIFMTGQEEIDITCSEIKKRLTHMDFEASPMLVLPIYSTLPCDLQSKIFDPVTKGTRKCIVATNIAETSLTVDGIRYVIDTGYIKMKFYNSKIGMDILQVFPCSQAHANQRKGRAGRTGPGVCYRLFTENAYHHEMLDTTVPEIQRTNLSNVVLFLKSLNVNSLLEFDFMDSPPQNNLLKSMFSLWMLGALDDKGNLTLSGRKMVLFPLDPTLAKILISGEKMRCISEVLTIVCMMSVPNVFIRPSDRVEESDATREKFLIHDSDHLTLLNIYIQWKNNRNSLSWCNGNYIDYKSLKKSTEIRQQLLEIMQKTNMQIKSSKLRWDIVRKCVCTAYFQNTAKIKCVTKYLNCLSGVLAYLHPMSALCDYGSAPNYVVYHELIMTTKEYIQCVTAIEPEWLAELCPSIYSINKIKICQ